MSNETERALDWEDTIENDGPDWQPVPEGVYDFEVLSFERARHGGSDKLPPCPKAIVSLKLTGPGGTTTIDENLHLHSKVEGILCAFFAAIGQRKKGEPLRMNWNAVVGARGRCKVGIRKWTGKDGEERTANEVKRFYEPSEAPAAPAAPTPAPTYQPGSF